MIKNKRKLAYLVIALIVGVAVAAGFVLSGDDPASTADGSKITSSASAPSTATSATSEDPLAVDPAKQEPMLDKFASKDPFVPLGVANASSSDDSSDSQTALTAKITVNGTSYTVAKGDMVPPSDSVFTVTSVTSSSVTFALIAGTFENGDTSITVNVGESVKVVKEDGTSYTLKVVSIGDDNGDNNASGHSISVLSITESNGTAMVTLEVDDKTYSDKKVGDTITTSWGEIKIISIDVDAQTVTIMHGDQTITLSAGQVVVK